MIQNIFEILKIASPANAQISEKSRENLPTIDVFRLKFAGMNGIHVSCIFENFFEILHWICVENVQFKILNAHITLEIMQAFLQFRNI
jgi:hypothetical protein